MGSDTFRAFSTAVLLEAMREAICIHIGQGGLVGSGSRCWKGWQRQVWLRFYGLESGLLTPAALAAPAGPKTMLDYAI